MQCQISNLNIAEPQPIKGVANGTELINLINLNYLIYLNTGKAGRKNDKEITLMAKTFEIRNSTAEFLTFIADGKEEGVQVLYQDETIWATQQAMSVLFDVKVPTINYHLSQIFQDGELQQDRTIRKIRIVQLEGNLIYLINLNYLIYLNTGEDGRKKCKSSSKHHISSQQKQNCNT